MRYGVGLARPSLNAWTGRWVPFEDAPELEGTVEAVTSLPEVSALITELQHWLPRAKAFSDKGDGLRSPSFEGRVSGGGGRTSPVEAVVMAGDPTADDGRPSRSAAARLAQAEAHIAAAKVELARALVEARRRTSAPP